MDGTVLTNGKISEYNLKMIKRAIHEGIRFVVASGRIYVDILPFLEEYDIQCACVTGNGAEYVDEQGKLVNSCYLRYEDCMQVIDILLEQSLNFMIYTTTGIFSVYPVEQVQDAFVFRGYTRFGKARNQTYEETYENIKKTHACFRMSQFSNYKEELKDKQIIKIEAFDYRIEVVEEAKKHFTNLNQVSYLSSYADNVEITNKNATKGQILEQAIKQYGIKNDEVMVLGDGLNDLSMFTRFENSVAMGNAEKELKEHAKYISDRFDEDGVGKAIARWVFGEK